MTPSPPDAMVGELVVSHSFLSTTHFFFAMAAMAKIPVVTKAMAGPEGRLAWKDRYKPATAEITRSPPR